MNKQFIITISICLAFIALLIIACGKQNRNANNNLTHEKSKSPITNDSIKNAVVEASSDWSSPEKVEIIEYNNSSLEPAISKDGKYLFFNSGYLKPKDTTIFYAKKISNNKFQFLGEVEGIKVSNHYSMTPEADANNHLYFSSDRADGKTPKIYIGDFKNGKISKVTMMPGTINQKRAWDPATFDGDTIYYTENANFAENFDIHISNNSMDEDFILQNINTGKMEYAPSVSQNQLELFFTKADTESVFGIIAGRKSKIYMATRKSVSEPFGQPEIISAIAEQEDDAFVEAPSITADGKEIYYHKKEGNKFAIYKVTRNSKQ